MRAFTDRELQGLAEQTMLRISFYSPSDIAEKWGIIRQSYMNNMPRITAVALKNPLRGIDPYFLDWVSYLNPIERSAWCSIRDKGIVLYPQFPVFNYFLDFANPTLKIGLELDGKSYHDSAKDFKRDSFLSTFGWKIFRVSSTEVESDDILSDLEALDRYYGPNWDSFTYQEWQIDEYDTDVAFNKVENWMLNTCDGVIESLKIIYFESHRKNNSFLYSLAHQSLENHRGANFDIL
ncbi:MAG TPA: DUF559 domain-containing protein [Candidatus Kapabacteria bacterium]|nr:DUF559 domain-containing protein [Candidatus Kapabacteria bacterium]